MSFGADFTSLDRMTFRSGLATTGAVQIDDVEILQVPEAGAAASALAAWASIAALARRRSASRKAAC